MSAPPSPQQRILEHLQEIQYLNRRLLVDLQAVRRPTADVRVAIDLHARKAREIAEEIAWFTRACELAAVA